MRLGLWAQARTGAADYNRYNRNMTSPRAFALPLFAFLSLAAGPLAAQGGHVEVAPTVSATPGSGGSAAAAAGITGASVSGGSALTLTPVIGGSVQTFTPSAPQAQVQPGAKPVPTVSPAVTAAAAVASPVSKAAAVTTRQASVSAAAAPVAGAQLPVAVDHPASAGTVLTGAAHGLSAARVVESQGGDGLSVHQALGRVFDAAANSTPVKGGVAGHAQGIRETVAQKVSIANVASPADAPDLYSDAITTAKNALPTSMADGVARVVRGFAARKAELSLGDLVSAAYEAAAGGSAKETQRLLKGLDKWESLLGAPGRPLVTNAEALKTDVRSFLDEKTARSVPHVWLERSGPSYTAHLPGSGVQRVVSIAKVPLLAAGFAIDPATFGPEAALAQAYRSFSSDPRAGSGAGLVYRARRALGSSVPGAAVSASRFWLRTVIEGLWRRVMSFFGAGSYSLAQPSGREALVHDSALARTAVSQAALASTLLSSPRLRVAGVREALASLARAAAAFESLSGERDARVSVAQLGEAFDAGARSQSLSESDELSAGLSSLVTTPGGMAHWASLLRAEAMRTMDARLWRSRAGAESINLGAERSAALSESVLIKRLTRAPLASVALDDLLWARGQGPSGEVRLSVDLRATDDGGGLRLLLSRGDKADARALESLGLSVYPTRAGLVAVLGAEDSSRDAEEVGLMAARAVALAMGEAPAPTEASLRALLEDVRRSPSAASALAASLDGRAAFAGASVIGLAGEYEAVGPVATVLAGKPVSVTALRDPDTGLLVYARAATAFGR